MKKSIITTLIIIGILWIVFTFYGLLIISGLNFLKFVEFLPGLIASFLVIIVGSIIALILSFGIRLLLKKIKLNKFLKKIKLTKTIGYTNVSILIAELIKWYIILIFLQASASLINLGTLSTLLNSLVMWLPQLLIAVIVMLVGLIIAYYLYMKIIEHTKAKGVKFIGVILKLVIIIITILIALKQVGIKLGILENIIQLLLGGIILLTIYFIPSLIGLKKKNAFAIFILNLFLGWTFFGWIGALVWACMKD